MEDNRGSEHQIDHHTFPGEVSVFVFFFRVIKDALQVGLVKEIELYEELERFIFRWNSYILKLMQRQVRLAAASRLYY